MIYGLNSSTLNTRELDFINCLQDRSNGITDGSLDGPGFITLPDGPYPARACAPGCGNGILESRAQCDDGNLINDDGCSDHCLVDAVVQP